MLAASAQQSAKRAYLPLLSGALSALFGLKDDLDGEDWAQNVLEFSESYAKEMRDTISKFDAAMFAPNAGGDQKVETALKEYEKLLVDDVDKLMAFARRNGEGDKDQGKKLYKDVVGTAMKYVKTVSIGDVLPSA